MKKKVFILELDKEDIKPLIKLIRMYDLTPNDEDRLKFVLSRLERIQDDLPTN